MRGIVKFYIEDKGYGFITGENGKDYFLHHSNLKGKRHKGLDKGQAVEFELKETAKGTKAINVAIVKEVIDDEELIKLKEAMEGKSSNRARR